MKRKSKVIIRNGKKYWIQPYYTSNVKCLCGCGRFLKVKFKHELNFRNFFSHKCYSKYRTGKSLEDLYGFEGAKRVRRNISDNHFIKGKTFEEYYGKKKSKDMKIKISNSIKGKTWEQIYGKEKARKKRLFHRNMLLGKSLEEIYGSKIKALTVKKLNSRSMTKRLLGKTYEEMYGKDKAAIMKKRCCNTIIKSKRDGLISLKKCPNNYEKIIIALNKRYNLGFDFVGNGKFWIGNINPDFVNKKLKIIIEVYHTFWKIKLNGSEKIYKKIRRKIALNFGYKVIFINENCIFNKNLLMEKLSLFQ